MKLYALCIDIGNSNIKIGCYNYPNKSNGELVNKTVIRTVVAKTPDEYLLDVKSFLDFNRIPVKSIKKVSLSSVVPPLTDTLRSVLRKLSLNNLIILAPGVKTGIVIKADSASEVGSDLIANAIACRKKSPDSAFVAVAFGTAITFTVVSGKGELLGVAIAPGIRSSMSSLFKDTAKLKLVELDISKSFIGKNTTHSMQVGLTHGFIGLANYILDGIIQELDEDIDIYTTGYITESMIKFGGLKGEFYKDMTLDGLNEVANKN